jgi:hypothetical protein
MLGKINNIRKRDSRTAPPNNSFNRTRNKLDS